MNVLLAAAELTPFVRTGALADSLVELSAGLQKAGHNVSVVLPYYRVIREDKSLKTKRSKIRFMVDVGPDQLSCEIREAQPLNGVRVFLVERDEFFDRSGIYGVEGRDYQDNAARFIFFTKCVVELAARMENPPEILHLNSWESALASALVRSRNLPLRTVLTPHSLEYQGNFWSYDFGLTNLPDDWFSAQGVEYFGSMNCLKAGLMFSDAVVFSSERMVGAVQTPEHGCGLDNVLREQRAKLVGIPTAVGLEGWLSEGGSFVDQAAGRAKNRALLEKTLGLDDGGPLLVCVSEATEGRGLDILLAAMDRILAAGMRLILLGPTGDPDHLIALEVAIRKHRRRFVYREKFDEKLARIALTGSDIFLLPGPVEPQTTWLRRALCRGTVPLAMQCEGLLQFVRDWEPGRDIGHGFVFYNATEDGLFDACRRAGKVWADPDSRVCLQERCLGMDFSPTTQVERHVALYERLLENRPRG